MTWDGGLPFSGSLCALPPSVGSVSNTSVTLLPLWGVLKLHLQSRYLMIFTSPKWGLRGWRASYLQTNPMWVAHASSIKRSWSVDCQLNIGSSKQFLKVVISFYRWPWDSETSRNLSKGPQQFDSWVEIPTQTKIWPPTACSSCHLAYREWSILFWRNVVPSKSHL